MSEIFKPRDYQRIAADHIIKHNRCAVWCFMGGGKSAATLTALEELSLTENIYPVLVIAPLRVAKAVWPEEVKKWKHTEHLKTSVIVGNVKEREFALKRQADVFIINFENVPWLVHYLQGKWPFKTIVVDEASKLKGFRLRQGTERARTLAKVAFRSKRFIELTGTPAANGVKDSWGQLWFLDQGERLGKTFTAFTNRWFSKSFDGFSLIPLPHAQKEIEEKLKDICLSIRAEDYFPTEAPIITKVSVALPVKVFKQYKELEKKMFVDLGKHVIEPLSAAAKTNKCLQFASGAPYIDDSQNWIEVHDEKITALKSIIEEANGMPVLVAYNFVSDKERILKAFPKAKVLEKDMGVIKRWNEGKIDLLLAHPMSAGHGLNLAQGGNILVYFSPGWDLELHDQIAERLGPTRQKQAGLNRSVFVYYILADNTIEHLVMERLQSKKSVQEILMVAMAKR